MTTTAWRIRAQCAWQRHGGWRAAALPLLIAGIAAWVLWIPSLLAEQQQREATNLSADLAQPLAARAPTRTPTATLRELLPQPVQTSELLSRIFTLAETHGVQLGKVEYRWEEAAANNDAGSHAPRRLQLGLPVHADYPVLKGFARDLLASEPAVSIDTLSLRRGTQEPGSASNGDIALTPDGMVWLSIWLRALVDE